MPVKTLFVGYRGTRIHILKGMSYLDLYLNDPIEDHVPNYFYFLVLILFQTRTTVSVISGPCPTNSSLLGKVSTPVSLGTTGFVNTEASSH